ncbi:MAG: phage terminase large subunit [Methanobrevibacter sp.]|nr:phage terminase large subunit [Methanobrevibacter sp.]
MNYCSMGKINAILEPSLNQCRRVFKQITKALSRSGLLASCNASTLTIEFKNGAEILFKSAAQGENLRGDTITGILIIDEAAFIPDEIIETILPTIDANNANLMIISTPLFTSGYFYEEYISAGNNKLVLN